MANNILPARTGELSYIYLLKKYHNKKVGEGIATLFVARVFDFISISLLFFISALTIQDLPAIITKVVWVIAFFMVLSVIFLITLLYFGGSFLNSVRKFFGMFNLDKKYFGDYLLRKGEETVESFEIVKEKRIVVGVGMISMAVWILLYVSDYVLLTAIGVNLNIWKVFLGITFLVFTTTLPIQSLGGFGTFEGGWTIGFVAVGVPMDLAISSGFIVHIIGYTYFLLLGIYGIILIKYFQS
jgi:uncharacterized protein (TIRG00374 family)